VRYKDTDGKDERTESDVQAGTGPGETLTPDAADQPLRFQGFSYDSGVKDVRHARPAEPPQAGRFLTQDRFESSSGDFNLVADPLT